MKSNQILQHLYLINDKYNQIVFILDNEPKSWSNILKISKIYIQIQLIEIKIKISEILTAKISQNPD